MKKIIFAAAAVALASSSALAADLRPAYKAPAPVMPAYNWTGFYIGGQVGGVSHSASFKDPNDIFDNQGLNPDRRLGFTGGVFGGANYQIGSLVLGVDAQWSWYGNKSVSSVPTALPVGAFFIDSNLRDAGNVKGRIGLAFNNTMVYVAAGPAWANTSLSFQDGLAGAAGSGRKTSPGLAAAIGVEHMITNNWIVRGQAQYSEYKAHYVPASNAFVASIGQQTSTLEATVGVAYKFGGF